jgi:hypothetical protein
LILIGIVKGTFQLYKLQRGSITECSNFAAIGTGAIIAEPVLYQRELQIYTDAERAVYIVYEAKRLGETAPGVGKRTNLFLLSNKDGAIKVKPLSDLGHAFMEKQFRRFGPREITRLNLPEHFWMGDESL